MITTASAPIDTRQRWSRWTMTALERIPLPYPLVVAGVGLFFAAEQALEYALYPAYNNAPGDVWRALAFPAVALYILTHLRILKKNAVQALIELRPSIVVTDQEYDEHVRRMVSSNRRTELLLLIGAAAVIVLVFWTSGIDVFDTAAPGAAVIPAVGLIMGSYVLLAWLVMSLVYCSIRHARELGALARRPLVINVFDPANLVAFGRLGLLHSLPSVGVALIPILFWGLPTRSGGFVVIALSTISLLTLFVPLWGVHQQIDQAKERALTEIYGQLQGVQAAVLERREGEPDPAQVKTLADRTAMLVNLRKVIQEAPNWPFKDTAAVARAALAVSAPLIYFVLNEILRAVLRPLLGP